MTRYIDRPYRSIVPYIRELLPSFIKDHDQNLIPFIDAFYTWLEQTGQVDDRIHSIDLIRDAEFGAHEFVEKFRKEFLPLIPVNANVDTSLLIRQVVDFYRSKGKVKALQFFFRAVYGIDVDVEHPSPLTVNESPYFNTKDNILRIHYVGGLDVNTLVGRTIYGLTTGSSATVTGVFNYTYSVTQFYELTIENIDKRFKANEIIYTNDGLADEFPSSGTVMRTYWLVTGASINPRGSNYVSGEFINFASTGSIVGPVVRIGKTKGGVLRINIVNAGAGLTDGTYPMTIVGNTGSSGTAAATATVSGGSVTSITVTDPGTNYTSATATLVGAGTPTATPTFHVVIKGELRSLDIVDPGVNLTSPSGSATAPTVTNPYVGVESGTGANITFKVGGQGQVYTHYERFNGEPYQFPEVNHLVYIKLDRGNGTFVEGETIYQYGNGEDEPPTFIGVVNQFQLENRRSKFVILEKDPVGDFSNTVELVGATSDAHWTPSTLYTRELLIDAGDYKKDREFTYRILSPIALPQNVIRAFKNNVHVAGLNAIVEILLQPPQPTGDEIVPSASARMFFWFDLDPNTLIDGTIIPMFRDMTVFIDKEFHTSLQVNRHMLISDTIFTVSGTDADGNPIFDSETYKLPVYNDGFANFGPVEYTALAIRHFNSPYRQNDVVVEAVDLDVDAITIEGGAEVLLQESGDDLLQENSDNILLDV